MYICIYIQCHIIIYIHVPIPPHSLLGTGDGIERQQSQLRFDWVGDKPNPNPSPSPNPRPSRNPNLNPSPSFNPSSCFTPNSKPNCKFALNKAN